MQINSSLCKSCAVCSLYFPFYYGLPGSLKVIDQVMLNYHNCHVSLGYGNLEKADQYLTLTAFGMKDSLNNPLYPNLLFLRSKIYQYRYYSMLAIGTYRYFLALTGTDSILKAEAAISLASLYYDKQQWKLMAHQLYAWYRNYRLYSDTLKKKWLYGKIITGFSEGKKIRHLPTAISVCNRFFKDSKDTTSLIDLYGNIANRYAKQSLNKQAIFYLQKALTLARHLNATPDQGKIYLQLSLIEEKNGNTRAALLYRKKFESETESMPAWTDLINDSRQNIRLPDQAGKNTSELTYERDSTTSRQLNTVTRQRNLTFIISGVLILFSLYTHIKKLQCVQSVSLLNHTLEKMEQLNLSKNELLSILSHDLRSALHTLRTSASTMKTLLQKGMEEEALLLAEETEKITNSTVSLLNNLLHWSLSQTDRVVYYLEKIAVKPLIEQVCYDFLPFATSKKIDLQHPDIHPQFCTGDVNSVKITLRNLIDNAIKYTPAFGTVVITAETEGAYCSISVSDTGIGINPEILHAIFNNTSNRIQQDASGRRSTGIGLWLARTIAEKNGGQLLLASKEGAGTRATLKLPAVL